MPTWDEVRETLKPFQRATTDAAFEGLWRPDTTNRFLVADEVGLGKTLVAKGVVARTIERLRHLGDERIDIVYICSSQSIARQNLQKLAEFAEKSDDGDDVFTHADRLTMLVGTGGLSPAGVNIVGLTPGTSFEFKRRDGKFDERALLYTVLLDIWPEGRKVLTSAGGMRVFYSGISEKEKRGENGLRRARRRLKEKAAYFQPRISERARELVEERVAARNKHLRSEGHADIYQQIEQLAPAFSGGQTPHRQSVQARLALIGDLRQLMADAGVRLLQPDLVIMDEFQRFADLLDPRSRTQSARLVDTFLTASTSQNRAPTKVLLLSATPYRWFDRSGEGSHHQDFLTTLGFLHHWRTEPVARVESALKSLREAIWADDLEAAEAAASTASIELRKVMCRTERLSSTDDRNGMLDSLPFETPIEPDDVSAYLAAQKLADNLGSPSVIELWRTSPWIQNLGDDYKLVQRLDEACAQDGLDWSDPTLLDIRKIADFEAIKIPNPRLRWLAQATVGEGWHRLLWVPATRPYYRVENDFSTAAERGMTKHLVFSSWRIAPKAIALGVTYQSEQPLHYRSPSLPGSRSDAGSETSAAEGFEEWGDSAYRSHNRTLLDLTDRQGERHGLTNFLLAAPLAGLCELVDPLALGVGSDGSPRSLDEVRHEAELLIAERLGVDGAERTQATEVDWYVWAARALGQADDWWAGVEAITFAGQEERKTAGLQAAIDAFRAPARPTRRPPAELEKVLVDIALGSPAVCALRALSRVLGVGSSDPEFNRLADAAARFAWGFRSYLNRPETINVVEHAGDVPEHWRRVLRYGAEGNLQSVLDEYFHMLREWKLGGLRGAEQAHKLASTAVEALSFRAVTLDARVPPADGGDKRKLRSRFAVRFGDRPGDDDDDRKDVTAVAFNSPFWPFVMATTSIGQEGLDFHLYSHALVHWNLPPDPVALEQREGRVHRYKGHAVRKNVAAVSNLRTFDPTDDLWDKMFKAVEPTEGYDGIRPYWVFEGDAKIRRLVPMLPMSREEADLERLRRAAAIYRLAFGQPRHDDLLSVLDGRRSMPTIDLSPRPPGNSDTPLVHDVAMSDWPEEWLASSPSKVCPLCSEQAVRPVTGGLPAPSVLEALDTGVIDLHLGGCALPVPGYKCSDCDAELDLSDGELVISRANPENYQRFARDRAVGALVGLAVGDAVGTTLEFKAPGTFTPITDMVGGGPFRLPAGAWTDDTSMAMCLAESILDTGGLDPVDQLRRYLLWWRDGYWSSTGSCFDIGTTTSRALHRFDTTGEPFDPRPHENHAANGSLMRLAAVPIRWHTDPAEAAERSGESSRTTHGAPRPVDACRLLGAMIAALIEGSSADEVFSADFWRFGPLHPEVEAVARGSWRAKQPPEIRGTGYSVDALEAAVWSVADASDYRDAVLRAANLGDDADTTAAIAGQLAGARWGVSGIPKEWRERVVAGDRIEAMAGRLYEEAANAPRPTPWQHDELIHAWWTLDDQVLAGEYPGHNDPRRAGEKLNLLLDHGIRTFVDLTTPGDGLEPYADELTRAGEARRLDVRHVPHPIPDMGVGSLDEYGRILATVREGAERGGVYVHCWGGMGRTGTVVGCLLADRFEFDTVIDLLQELRAETRKAHIEVPQTAAQSNVIREWAARKQTTER